jgi:hypothetical protein
MVLPRSGSPKYNKSGSGEARSIDVRGLLGHFDHNIMRFWRAIGEVEIRRVLGSN